MFRILSACSIAVTVGDVGTVMACGQATAEDGPDPGAARPADKSAAGVGSLKLLAFTTGPKLSATGLELPQLATCSSAVVVCDPVSAGDKPAAGAASGALAIKARQSSSTPGRSGSCDLPGSVISGLLTLASVVIF